MDDAFSGLTLVLLAAGRGERFGGGKLRALLHGRPLADHAAALFAALPFERRWAVVGDDDCGLAQWGFELVRAGGPGQGDSLAAGVKAAAAFEPRGIMIALADMPFVDAGHVTALAEQFDGERIASSDGARLLPPALFGPAWYARLGAISGDRGARELLFGAKCTVAAGSSLRDIDTIEDIRLA